MPNLIRRPTILALFMLTTLGLGALAAPADAAETREPENLAMLVGSPEYPARDLFEVEFFAVDGENISPREVIWLEPGRHVITVRVPHQFTESLINQRRRKWTEYADIELELEAGKIYDIRGRYNRTNRNNPYDLIVDSVKDRAGDGTPP